MKSSNSIIITIAVAGLAYLAYHHYQHFKTIDSKILAIALMVKNEETAMPLTLQPLIDAGITQFLIYDTGSTDNTIAIAREIFIKNNITDFVIEQGPWVDYSTCRNKTLQLTEQHFPNATFMFMPDAEWILHNGADLLKFCHTQKHATNVVYSFFTTNPNLAKPEDRLFRTKSNVHFVGKVHEWPNVIAQQQVPSNIFIEFTKSSKGYDKSAQRWIQDIPILQQELQKNPKNLRAMAMLAQTYFWLKDYQNAIKWYEKLITFSYKNNEDAFSNYLQLAISYEQAERYDQAIATYQKAFQIRPCRADPLIHLAILYYNKKNYKMAFLFAKQAMTIPFPTNERGTINKSLYDATRYEIVSLTAHLFNEYELGKQATIKMLQVNPNLKHMQQQLKFYESKLRNF